LLIAANEGVQEQSRRHGTLLSLLGLKQVVVLVNKMDLVDYSRPVFEKIEAEYRAFLKGLGVDPLAFVPMSARGGANVVSPASAEPGLAWYQGPTVLEQLDRFQAPVLPTQAVLRFPVQDVYRFDARRILAGRVESGSVKVGDELAFWPGGKRSKVASVERWSSPVQGPAVAGESVGLTLTEQIFVERGHVATRPESPLIQAHEIQARVFWLGKQPLTKGRRYKLKLATQEVEAEVKEIRSVLDSSSLDSKGSADSVQRNEVAELVLSTRTPVAFDNHELSSGTGRFVLVDGYDMAGGGIVSGHAYAGHASTDLHYNTASVTPAEREKLKGHKGAVVWLTGLSGSGKSTIANALERELTLQHVHCYQLDGDNLRFGLNRDLGFDDADRRENIRRAAEVALLFSDSSAVVIISLISPFREDRLRARSLARERQTPFFEVFVDAPLAVCEARDPKGLYAKARRGEIAQFTGISSPYEAPEDPALALPTAELGVEACVTRVMDLLLGAIRPRK
ncbi:MAG: adenylyl-sulfate kinase, partial [bacterium]